MILPSAPKRAIVLSSVLLAVACGGQAPSVPALDGGPGADTGPRVVMGPDAGPLEGSDAGTLGAGDAGAPGAMCPPTPTGSGQVAGDVAADLVLMDCDGNPHSLHDLCERDAVWLFEFADWCPPCRSFASSSMNRIYSRFEGERFEAWMVISADAGFGAPDAEDCAAIRDRYGAALPVLFDPTGAFQDHFGVAANEVHIVLSRGARIEWIGHYAASQVEARIESTLGL